MRGTIRKPLLAITMLVLPLLAQKHVVPMDETGKQGMLDIYFVDADGKPLKNSARPIVTIEDVQTGRKLYDRQVAIRNVTLPYGTYWLRVQLSPAYPIDKKVVIRDRFQVAFVSFIVAPIELPWDGNLVHGVITTRRSEDKTCRWVRLISAFSESHTAEAKASDDGRFTVENIKPGTYLGVVSGAHGICGVARVKITDERLQAIELHDEN